MNLKLTTTHIFCLLSLIFSPFSDSYASACENHSQQSVPNEAHSNLGHDMSHMNHDMTDMNNMKSHLDMQEQAVMPCCDDCDCQFSNCHNQVMLSVEAIGVDLITSNFLNAFQQITNQNIHPTHPYRPPIS